MESAPCLLILPKVQISLLGVWPQKPENVWTAPTALEKKMGTALKGCSFVIPTMIKLAAYVAIKSIPWSSGNAGTTKCSVVRLSKLIIAVWNAISPTHFKIFSVWFLTARPTMTTAALLVNVGSLWTKIVFARKCKTDVWNTIEESAWSACLTSS